MLDLYTRRRLVSAFNLTVSALTTLFGLFWLGWLLWTLISNGLEWIDWTVLTEATPPPGSSGGLANAIVGSLLLTGLATLIGTPAGILAGTFLSEYGRGTAFAAVIRFLNDILLSAPSIIIGVFIYALVVVPMGHFSGLGRCAGAGPDRAAGGGAHHRRHAAPGAQQPA